MNVPSALRPGAVRRFTLATRKLCEKSMEDLGKDVEEAICALDPALEGQREEVRRLLQNLVELSEQRTDVALGAQQELSRVRAVHDTLVDDLLRERRKVRSFDSQMDLIRAQLFRRDARAAEERKAYLREITELRQQLWRVLNLDDEKKRNAIFPFGLDFASIIAADDDVGLREQEDNALKALEELKRDHLSQLHQLEAQAAEQQSVFVRKQRDLEQRHKEELERVAKEGQSQHNRFRKDIAELESSAAQRTALLEDRLQHLKTELRAAEQRATEAERRVLERDDMLRVRAEEMQDVQRQRHMLKGVVHRLQERLVRADAAANAAVQGAAGAAAPPSPESLCESPSNAKAMDFAPPVASAGDDAGDDMLRELEELRGQVQDDRVRLQEAQAATARAAEQHRTAEERAADWQAKCEELQEALIQERALREAESTAHMPGGQSLERTGSMRFASSGGTEADREQIVMLQLRIDDLVQQLQERLVERTQTAKERDVDRATIAALRDDLRTALGHIRRGMGDEEADRIAAELMGLQTRDTAVDYEDRSAALVLPATGGITATSAALLRGMHAQRNVITGLIGRLRDILADAVRLRERHVDHMRKMLSRAAGGDPDGTLCADLSDLFAAWRGEGVNSSGEAAGALGALTDETADIRAAFTATVGSPGWGMPPSHAASGDDDGGVLHTSWRRALTVQVDPAVGQSLAGRLWVAAELSRIGTAASWSAAALAEGRARRRAAVCTLWAAARTGVMCGMRVAGSAQPPQEAVWWHRRGLTLSGGCPAALDHTTSRAAWQAALRLAVAAAAMRTARHRAVQWAADAAHAVARAVGGIGAGSPVPLWQGPLIAAPSLCSPTGSSPRRSAHESTLSRRGSRSGLGPLHAPRPPQGPRRASWRQSSVTGAAGGEARRGTVTAAGNPADRRRDRQSISGGQSPPGSLRRSGSQRRGQVSPGPAAQRKLKRKDSKQCDQDPLHVHGLAQNSVLLQTCDEESPNVSDLSFLPVKIGDGAISPSVMDSGDLGTHSGAFGEREPASPSDSP